MRHHRLIGCVIAAIFTLSANAQLSSGAAAPLPERHVALAMKFLELVGYRDTWADSARACTNDVPSKARKAFKENPGSFGGLSPQSAYRPDVERIYAKYEKSKCDATSSEGIYREFSEGFARNLSEADLAIAIEFYSSEAGKRIQRATVEASGAVMAEMNKKLTAIDDEATATFRIEFKALASKYREDPK